MAQSLPTYPGGVLASPFHLVSAMAETSMATMMGKVPEGLLIDGKAGPYKRSDEFLKDVSCFANGSGGILVLGMEEAKPEGRWIARGIREIGKVRMQLRDWLMALEPPGVPDLSMEQVAHGGMDFLVVQIPRARHRPVCFQMPDGQCQFWVRDHDKKRPLSLREVFDAFATRYRRYDRRSLVLNSMRKRFEEASPRARSVRVTMVVGAPSEADVAFLQEHVLQGKFRAMTTGTLSGPLLLRYDEDLAKSFGNLPEMWICRADDQRPIAVRLPGSTSLALFDSPMDGAVAELQSLAHDAGMVFGDLLRAHQAFRLTYSDIGSSATNPSHLWLLHLALEAARLPMDDPLRCHVRSWLFGVNFDYSSAFGEDFHPPFAHVVSQEQMREAALRRLRFEFQGDLCLLSAVSLLGLSHSMFEA
jgi:hypothetical protein